MSKMFVRSEIMYVKSGKKPNSLDWKNGILSPKLFWSTVKKNCSRDPEILLKLEAEGREFAKILRSLEHFIQTATGQNNF